MKRVKATLLAMLFVLGWCGGFIAFALAARGCMDSCMWRGAKVAGLAACLAPAEKPEGDRP